MATTTIMNTTTGTGTSAPDILVAVARYREDLGWLAQLGLPCVVYNKGPELDPAGLPPGVRVETLPNVGREAHTYLTHILAAYGSLPRHTVLLQGNPFAHLAPPQEPAIGPEGLRQRILELATKDLPFAGLAWFRLTCDPLGRPHDLADPAKQGRWKGWGRDIPVGEVFEALFGPPAPRQFIARAPTGNMVVRADRILARPPEFYRRALELVLADPQDERNTGHALERLWQAMRWSGCGRPCSPEPGARGLVLRTRFWTSAARQRKPAPGHASRPAARPAFAFDWPGSGVVIFSIAPGQLPGSPLFVRETMHRLTLPGAACATATPDGRRAC